MKKSCLITLLVGAIFISDVALARRGEPEPGDDRGGDSKKVEDSKSDSSGKNSNGKNSSSKSKSKRTRYTARLSSVSDFATTSRAKADYRVENKEQRFTINLHLPFAADSVSSIGEAKLLNMKATLIRDGSPYTECLFKVDDDSDDDSVEDNQSGAEFKVNIRKNATRSSRGRKGSCDINLTSAGFQTGMPTVKDGDAIEISEDSAGVFMQGEF